MNQDKPHALWRDTPIESRFGDPARGVQDAIEYTARDKRSSKEFDLDLRNVQVIRDAEEIKLGLPSGRSLKLTPWAFDRVAASAKAPADFLRELPAPIVESILRERFAGSEIKQALVRVGDDDLVLRDLASVTYERTWVTDVLGRIQEQLIGTGWRIPPARPAMSDHRTRKATPADCVAFARHSNGMSIKPGDDIAPAGCYVEDHVTNVFLIKDEPFVGPLGKEIFPGIMISFGELYGRAVNVDLFGLVGVCGNHLIDGFTDLGRTSLSHRRGVNDLSIEVLAEIAQSKPLLGAGETLDRASKLLLSEKTETLIDDTFAKIRRIPAMAPITKKLLGEATRIAVENENRYGDPRTLWAIHSGLTQASQSRRPDDRYAIDRAASRMLTIDV